MITLRPYQEEAVNQALWHFQNYNNPFIVLAPTGSGKSYIISEICHRLNEPILILQPTKEILEQNYAKLRSYGIDDIGIYSASMNSKTIDKFTYATIGSIYKKPELFSHFKYVLIDEAHLVDPKNINGMYSTFFAAINCHHICGLTATPYRLIHKYYQEKGQLFYTSHLQILNRIYPFFFKKFAYKVDIQELIEKNYLCKIQYKLYEDFDTSNVKINTTGADYDTEAIERFWNDSRLMKLSKIIGEIDKECKHNLIFCSSIRQADRGKELLKLMGLSAESVSGNTSPKERDRIISEFREGKIKHLLNCNVLSIGFDFPQLDAITLARPTLSLLMLYQQIGRGVRIDPNDPDKICKVYDITKNTVKFGKVETIKIEKESDGFRDIVTTEKGIISGKPLFKFAITNEKKLNKLNKIIE